MTHTPASPRADAFAPSFTPVPVRARHDGWSDARQLLFLHALADSGCVAHACAHVGRSVTSAYALRQRPGAQSFRQAWDMALDFAVQRLSDAVLSRAIHGVPQPVFYQGQQIGERRVFNDRLAMFLLRQRQPERFGAWRDDMMAQELHPDGPAIRLGEALRRVAEDGADARAGRPARRRRPLMQERIERAQDERWDETLTRATEQYGDDPPGGFHPDVA